MSTKFRNAPPSGKPSQSARAGRKALTSSPLLGSQELKELENQTFLMEERLAALRAQMTREPTGGPKWISSKKLSSRNYKASTSLTNLSSDLKSSTIKLPPLPNTNVAPPIKTWSVPEEHQRIIQLEPEEDFRSKAKLNPYYDERESAESFQEALEEWRQSRQQAQPSTSSERKVEQENKVVEEVERYDETAAKEDFAIALAEWRNSSKRSEPKGTENARVQGNDVERYDEAASASEFQEALLAWRSQKHDKASRRPHTASTATATATGTETVQRTMPRVEISFATTSSLSEEEQLLLKHARLQHELGLYDEFLARQSDTAATVNSTIEAFPELEVQNGQEGTIDSRALDFLMGRIEISQL